MADTATDRFDATSDSRDSGMGTNKRGLSWWSVIRAEITCFIYFVASFVWMIFLAVMLLTGIIVAVDHSFIWGALIVVVTFYTLDRTKL